MIKPAGIVMLAALLAAPAAASAGSPLRPPSLGERAVILSWVDLHPFVAGPSSAVNRICVHRKRPRHAVVRFAHVTRGAGAVLLRRRASRWRRSNGGQVRRALLRRSCTLRPTPKAPPVDATRVLGAQRFGPITLRMTFGGAQWSTRTKLDHHTLFQPPCQTFGARGLGTSFWGLTTNDVILRLVITAPVAAPGVLLATAEGLRIGDSEVRVIQVYGAPDRRRPAPFIESGEQLVYRTGTRRRRIVTTDRSDRVVEVSVGRLPEVEFDEGCA